MNLTEQFVDYIYLKSTGEIPEKIYKQAQKCLIDYIGVTNAGAKSTRDNTDKLERMISKDGRVSIIGLGKHSDVLSAAFTNGFNAHVMELDDGHRFGMIHLAAPIISAVLAVGQNENSAGNDLLKGIILGYEAAVKIARAVQPSHKKRGFHTSGTCGTIGAAIGSAIVLGADRNELKAVLSAAGTSAAGLLRIQNDSSQLKPYNTAHAAMSGVSAAYIGKCGFCTPDDILGGDTGFLKAVSDCENLEKVLCDEGYFEIEHIYMKSYSACRHCHSAIEAALHIRNENYVEPNEIEKIVVSTYGLAIKGHDHTFIQGISSAKLSIPYCVAAAYILDSCGLVAFEEKNVTDRRILELAEKVSVEEDEEFSALSSQKRIAEVTVYDLSGREFSCRVDYAKGDFENPLTDDELRKKFEELMDISGACSVKDKIFTAVGGLMDNSDNLYSLL